MYCENCGKENENGANFCEFCGTPLKKPEETEKSNKSSGNKKRVKIVIICAAAVLTLCIIGTVIFLSSQKTAEYNDKISSADKYLQEVDYSKAEAAYLKAIKIDPKKETAYIKLANLYISQGKHDEAADILQMGVDNIGKRSSEEFNRLYDEVKEGKRSPQYQAYYELVQKKQEEYGKGYFEYFDQGPYDDEYYDDGFDGDLKGLMLVKLFDFNDDGNDELILAYIEQNTDEYDISSDMYYFEVWAWQDDKLVNVLEKTEVNHGQGVGCWINTINKDNTTYLSLSGYDEEGTEFLKYMKYENLAFVVECELGYSMYNNKGEEEYLVNGESASSDEYFQKIEEFDSTNNIAMLNEDGTLPLKLSNSGEFVVYLSYLSEEYGEDVLAETERTIKLLKGAPKKTSEISESNVLKNLPTFTFASGAGAWMTTLEIKADGTFRGEYTDSNMGETGDGYPNGTVAICKFSGKFTDVRKVNDYVYSMELDSINTEDKKGEEYISDGIKYVASDPYGMKPGKKFYLYLPGAEIDSLPDEFYQWISAPLVLDENIKVLPCHGLYNEKAKTGFFSEE